VTPDFGRDVATRVRPGDFPKAGVGNEPRDLFTPEPAESSITK
jgi:hypothetical protein